MAQMASSLSLILYEFYYFFPAHILSIFIEYIFE